ncbi:MAG TPA: phosphotransferase [Pyrinomonadaceae bacterium]|nr:phosphotransferase [Pyrinomonadaceae bacterium]
MLEMVRPKTGITTGLERRTAIMSYLREKAPRYFSEFINADVNVRLLSEVQRPQSKIYRFQLEANRKVRFLRVKVPRYHNAIEGQGQGGRDIDHRPRRFSVTDLETKFQLEFAALSNIRKYFEGFHDARFGTVNVLDSLADFRGSVMEEVNNPSLRTIFVRENRIQKLFTSAGSNEAFINAGSWLRAYHSLPLKATDRHQCRTEFIDANIKLTDYLSRTLAEAQFFQEVASTIQTAALAVLPDSLPVGLGHGDYAMRNILVGAGSRVTVLDTLARWRTAIYEDIGYFLTNLKVAWPQVISQGLAFKESLIKQCEKAFLSGYFDVEPVPIQAVQLYEVQALLDRWSGRVARFNQLDATRPQGTRRLRLTLENRYYKISLRRLMQYLN